MHEFLPIGSRRTRALRSVVVMLHAVIANALVLRVRVVETGHRLRIVLVGEVRDGVLLVLLVDGARDRLQFRLIGEV